MLTNIHPKLPMRNKIVTRNFYVDKMGFQDIGLMDYEGYLMVKKDEVEIHFFEYRDLNPAENYGQVYIRTNDIDEWHQLVLNKGIPMPAAGGLQTKPWGQKEFSVLDPDHNLLTFGQSAS